MKFVPLVSWWWIALYLAIVVPAAGWQIWRVWQVNRRDWLVLLPWLRRALLALLPAFLALGPSVPGGTSAPGVANLDVLFAVDTTPSMGALDYDGTQQRIVGVRNDILALAAKLQGAHFELITFDTSANVVLPLTDYSSALSSAVADLSPQFSAYSQGSAIDKPLDLITQELKNSKAANPQRKRLLFYFGDGEQTLNAQVVSFAPLATYLSGGAVLGYGTTQGAQMINYTNIDPVATNQVASYITTLSPATGQPTPAVSKLNPSTLQTMADQLNVTYQDRDAGGSINSVYQASQTPLVIDHSQHIVRYLNLYWLLAIPLVGLLFWEWQALVIKLFELRRHKGAVYAER